MSPDISVIIAAYNVENYIERTINSALAQAEGTDTPSIEVIIVDDASTDRTWEIVSRINDPRLRRFQLLCNSGPGAARNVGISRASGQWIAVLDGDDAFLAGRLARLMKLAASQAADIVVDNLSISREPQGTTSPMFSYARLARLSGLSLSEFIAGNKSFMGGYALGYMKPVFSAAFLRRHGLCYYTDLRIGEDYLLMAQALAMGARCVIDPTAGYLYTSRVGSISHRLRKEDILRIAAADEMFLTAYRLPPAAMKAQRIRQSSLKEAYAFARLVEAIKGLRFLRALLIAVTAPLAARHLWRPVWKRVSKIFSIFMLTRKESEDVRSAKIFSSEQNT